MARSSATAPEPSSDQPDIISQAINNAEVLIDSKKEIQGDLQSAREFLNQAVKLGITNDEQTAWIAENLPKRTRVGKDDGDDTQSEPGADPATEPGAGE